MRKKLKYRRVAMRRDEMDRRKRMKTRDLEDIGFGILVFTVFIGCPVVFILGVLGVLPS